MYNHSIYLFKWPEPAGKSIIVRYTELPRLLEEALQFPMPPTMAFEEAELVDQKAPGFSTTKPSPQRRIQKQV